MEAKLDCGDNSCEWAEAKTGMRTNGGCRCLKDLDFSRRMAVRGYIKALREENARLHGLIGGYFRVPSSEWIEALKTEARALAAAKGGEHDA